MSLSSVKVSGGIQSRSSLKVACSLVDNVLAAPINVMSRNAGNGVLEVAWTPAGGIFDHWDVYISPSIDGPFSKANFKPIQGTVAKIFNLSFGNTIFTKVRGVDAAGNIGPFSALAVDAVASRATTQLRFVGPVGDQVPAGAVFCAIANDEVIGVRTTQSGTLS